MTKPTSDIKYEVLTFYIHSPHDIVVKKDGEVFLVVKRNFWLGIRCRFFKDDQLILKSYMFPFLLPFVRIKDQNLPKEISLYRKRDFFYSILYDDVELSLELKSFRNPFYFFLKDGIQEGALSQLDQTIGEDKLYKLKTDIDDEDVNLLFLILLYMQTIYF